MSDVQTVLYDVPGPRARRRALIGTVLALVAIAALVGVALLRLADRGQFDMDLWGPWVDPSTDEFGQVWSLVGRGLLATLIAAALAILLSLAVGVVLGVGRMMSPGLLKTPFVVFIELFRGLPVVITIFLVWRVLVELERSTGVGIGWLPGDDPLWWLVIGLTLYNSVIIAEILRAGVASLPRGQAESALAVGMTRGQAMRFVQLPQAFRTMLPALVSQLVVILKDTSLVAVIGLGYQELLDRGNQISLNLDNPIQSLLIVGAIYIVINYALSRLAIYIERRLSRSGMEAGGEDAVPAT